jgi:hypothetical protein
LKTRLGDHLVETFSRLHLQLLVLLWLVIEDHDNLFIMAESVHFLGIGLLIYKLMTKKNAGGSFLLLCCLISFPRACAAFAWQELPTRIPRT